MTSSYSFPNAEDIEIIDVPVPQLPTNAVIPVHLPLFVGYAPTGRPNKPVIGDYPTISAEFGADAFNIRSPYFSLQNLYARTAMQYQQVGFVRVVDPEATAASSVLQVSVTPGNIIQYQRNAYGAIILNNGIPVPMVDGTGATITQPGVTLAYSIRQLAANETYDKLEPSTAVVAGTNITTYPIFATATGSIVQSSFVPYPGSAANNNGWTMYWSNEFDASTVSNTGSMTYRFVPMTLDPDTALPLIVYDTYNDPYTEFSFKPNAYDPSVAMYYELGDLASANFTTTPVPYSFQVYSEYVQTVLEAIYAVSPELANDGFVNGNIWMINFLSGQDQNGNPYQHVVVAENSILNADAVNYQIGGSDGTMSKANLEALTIAFLEGELDPQWLDKYRYPFTHFYDSGFALPNKELLTKIWANRDDMKIDFTTQDSANPANTQAQDQSTGAAIRAQILLYPESVVQGTQAIRGSIYQQCGKLNSQASTYQGLVPCNIDRLIKRCLYDGSDHVSDSPKGRPNSEVTIFNPASLNWTPTTAPQMQAGWDVGLNYIAYCDLQTLFYSDLRSIYPIDTSLLSDDVIVDYLIYIKHVARRIWTYYSGINIDPKKQYDAIGKRIDKEINRVLGGRLGTTTTLYQTDADAALGYRSTVKISVTGDMPSRVWDILIPVSRNTTSSSTTSTGSAA